MIVLKIFCGQVSLLVDQMHFFQRASHTFNNVAELCALLHALAWAYNHRQTCSCFMFAYDSIYAANVVRRIWHPRTSIALVLQCRFILDLLTQSNTISWTHFASHTGVRWNERADHLASCGGKGLQHYSQNVFVEFH